MLTAGGISAQPHSASIRHSRHKEVLWDGAPKGLQSQCLVLQGNVQKEETRCSQACTAQDFGIGVVFWWIPGREPNFHPSHKHWDPARVSLCPLAGDLLPYPAEHCKASCKDNSYSLLTALFPSADSFVLLFSPPCTSHPLPYSISVGHLLHTLSFSCSCCCWRYVWSLLAMEMLPPSGSLCTFPLPSGRQQLMHCKLLSTPGLLTSPRLMGRLPEKKKNIKCSARKNNHGCIQMNTTWFTLLGPH